MKKRLTSLVLLLMLAAGAFAGVPLPFGASECSMGTMDMDCCEAALMQRGTPQVDAAKLCCALNCAQNGTSVPPGIVRLAPPSQSPALAHPINGQATELSLPPLRLVDQLPGPPRGYQPIYIRHLALLI